MKVSLNCTAQIRSQGPRVLTLYDCWLAKHAHPEATAQWVCEDVKSLPIKISRDGEEKQSIDRSIGEEEYFAAGGDLDDGEEDDDDDASALSTNRIREQYLAAQTPRAGGGCR